MHNERRADRDKAEGCPVQGFGGNINLARPGVDDGDRAVVDDLGSDPFGGSLDGGVNPVPRRHRPDPVADILHRIAAGQAARCESCAGAAWSRDPVDSIRAPVGAIEIPGHQVEAAFDIDDLMRLGSAL